jgi:outer membrane murein-binding lipoprotein Lpp
MSNDVLISLLIVGAVLIGVILSRREARADGKENPVGTAKVQSDVTNLGARLGRLESAVQRIEKDIERAPSAADFEKLRGDIKAHAAITDGVKGHVESVDHAVVRIEMKLDGLMPSPPVRRTRK